MNFTITQNDAADEDPSLPLSAAQEGIWLGHQRAQDASIYNAAQLIVLDDTAQFDALLQAIRKTFAEASALQIRFIESASNEPRIVRRIEPREIEIETSQASVTLSDALKLARERSLEAFDLDSERLVHHGLFPLSDGRIAWLHVAHHILLDGYGFNLFARRVAENYEVLVGHKQSVGPAFTDILPVVTQDAEYQRSAARDEDLEFWRQEQAAAPGLVWGALEEPARALRVITALPTELVHHLELRARAAGLNWLDVALASIARVAANSAGRGQFSLGLPIMLRLGTAALRTPCMAMNIVPLRVDTKSCGSLLELAEQIRASQARQRAHQRFRYEHLKREGLSQSLFGPVVNVMPFDFPLRFAESPAELYEISTGPVMDLSFSLVVREGVWTFCAEGHPLLFCRHDLEQLLSEVTSQWNQLLDSFESTEKNEPSTAEPTPVCALARLKSVAKGDPQRVAFEWHAGSRLSYLELQRALDACAFDLTRAGVRANTLVAVELERGPLAAVVLLAVHWLGATYVVLDPQHPASRRASVLEQTRPVLWVRNAEQNTRLEAEWSEHQQHLPLFECSESMLAEWSRSQTLHFEHFDAACLDRPAYVTFTSGSSGEPKGVVTSFSALQHFVAGALQRYGVLASDRVLCFANFSFDTSVEELFVTLAAGGTLVFREQQMLESVDHFLSECARLRLSVLDLPTSYFHELAFACSRGDVALPTCLRTVIIGGEAVQGERVRMFCNWAPRVRLINSYGPSEATVVATSADLCANELLSDVAPIGTPLPGVTALLVDPEGRILEGPGTVGELYLLGPTLADGYLGREDLTREKFVYLADGRRAYKTGDLVSRGVRGQFFFRGRVDDELKIAGHRVAPAEVEAMLCQHADVRHAVVWGQSAELSRASAGSVHLCACVEASVGLSGHDLMKFSREKLPSAMVPTRWRIQERLPLTSSGKLDRARIKREAWTTDDSSAASASMPKEGTLSQVIEAWREVLGVEQIEETQNFFDLGGSSLHVIQLANRLTRLTNADGPSMAIRVAELFQRPTALSQATWIESGRLSAPERARRSERVFTPSPLELTLPQRVDLPPAENGIERVLLTGATGFLGIYLLNSWLRLTDARVVCVVRASSVEHAWKRLESQAQEFCVDLPAVRERVELVIIDEEDSVRTSLEHQVSSCSAVVHCAAQVSLTRDYESLLQSNVTLTRDLLEWAGQHGAEFHFISTIATLPAGEGDEKFYPLHVGLHDGYQQSKAHAELLCESAARQGLKVAVYRLGRVVGARSRPHVNSNDLVWRIARSSARVGLWPDVRVTEPWAPVDELADSILQLARSERAQNSAHVFHLVQHGSVALEQVFAGLLSAGIQLRSVSVPVWMEAVKVHGDAEDLATLAFFELTAANGAPGSNFVPSFVNTRTCLGDAQARPISQTLINQYCESAKGRGLLRSISPFSNETAP